MATSIEENAQKIIDRFKELSLEQIKTAKESQRMWRIYSEICESRYKNKLNLSDKENREVDILKRNFYLFFEREHSLEDKFLSPIFEQVDDEWKNPSPLLARNNINNTTFDDDPPVAVMKNMLYVSKISEENIKNIKNYLVKSKIQLILEKYYRSYIGIVNVRAYRFSNNPDIRNTHYGEKEFQTESNGEIMRKVNVHTDSGLPSNVIKIMIYKSGSPNNELITENHGVTEIKERAPAGAWRAPTGKKYPCLIFNSYAVIHKAPEPHPGHIRDAIELTILPRLENDLPIIQAGNMSGMCKNPFVDWSK